MNAETLKEAIRWKLVISPMIDARARKVAERLGIETYSDSIEVEAL